MKSIYKDFTIERDETIETEVYYIRRVDGGKWTGNDGRILTIESLQDSLENVKEYIDSVTEETQYKVPEEPTDIMETAKELDKLMQDYYKSGYQIAGYNLQRAFEDLENDPYGIVMELIKIIRKETGHV